MEASVTLQFAETAISATRFSARTLLTVCAATLLLVSSSQKGIYDKALVELNTLEAVDYHSLLANIAIMHDAEVRSQADRFRALLEEFNFSLSLSDGNAIYAETYPDNLRGAFVNVSSLDEIEAAFSEVSEIRGEANNVPLIEVTLRKVLTDIRPKIPQQVAAVWLSFSRGDSYTEVTVGWGDRSDQKATVRIDERLATTRHFKLPINLLDELSAIPKTATLVRRASGGAYFLPGTKEVWDEVRNRSVAEAREFLARQNDPRERVLEVFGLSIPERLVSWLAPLIILGVSVHMFAYIRRLSSLIDANPMLVEYPWIHLMRDRLAALVSVLLLVLLPVFTLIWTAIQTWQSSGILIRLVSGAALLGTVFFVMLGVLRLPSIRLICDQFDRFKRGKKQG